jgi:hypothetical protein
MISARELREECCSTEADRRRRKQKEKVSIPRNGSTHSALKLKRLQQGSLQQKMKKMSILRNGSLLSARKLKEL